MLTPILLISLSLGEFRYPPGTHGGGELRLIDGVPLLILRGTPEEMGEQHGTLAVRPLAPIAEGIIREVSDKTGLGALLPIAGRVGGGVLAKYPDAYRREFEAMARVGGVSRDTLIVANTLGELRPLAGCSGLMLDPSRAGGAALMGRNWDFPPIDRMGDYMLVTVRRPAGKKAFAAVGFPGSVASHCQMTAINSAGLCLGGNEILRAGDKSPRIDLSKTPSAVLTRRILEECGTLEEALVLAKANPPGIQCSLVMCDRAGGGVLEMTPRTVALRRGTGGAVAGTNHLLAPGLATPQSCPRLERLDALAAGRKAWDVPAVWSAMHEASQGDWTVQTVVLEPATLRVHLAFGDGKTAASGNRRRMLELGAWLK